jgi:phosphopantetheinyl transferase (holo-ACP synthase)
MEKDFIYWRHVTAPGIKVEEICGAEDRSGRVWIEMARQVYCENGKDGYRVIEHFDSGAPYLDDEPTRISVSHTTGLLVVASLPKTPEANLEIYSPRTAMGIDAEKLNRKQVLSIRSRFLNESEMSMIADDDIAQNILAWTSKEALYKAALTPGLDFRKDIHISKFPDMKNATIGEAEVVFSDGHTEPFELFSYESEGCCVTIAYSPKCAKYQKRS